MMKTLLVATDGSAHAQKAAEMGVELAKNCGGKVFAVYVADIGRYFEPIEGASWNIANEVVNGIKSAVKEEGTKAIKRVEELANKANVPVETKFIEGHPADDIMKFAGDTRADIIVLGSIGVRGIRKFQLGSVTEKVIRHSMIPVLIVY